ncbi:ATP-binding cassette domain-containing protein [Chloroflexota bacterium]
MLQLFLMIIIQSLQKVVQQRTVIDIPEFLVSPGEIVAIVGPVGSGKSQLLDLLIGKVRPTAGSIRIADSDPTQRDTFSRSVGVLFSEDSLYPRQTVRQNLAFQARLYGLPSERIDDVLIQVGLADHGNTRAEKLSSGLARRLAFGRAILHQPKIMILVEPFERCDEATITLLTYLIRKQGEKDGAVLVLALDVANLHAVCDTVYLLNQGKITENYNPGEEIQAGMPFKIPVRLEGKVMLINPVDILFADAAEGRAYLQTLNNRLPTQFTLSELEERLVRSGFFRAHRSYLVNLQHVKEVIPYTRNSFSLRLDDEDNTEIPLSKSAAGELRELLGY